MRLSTRLLIANAIAFVCSIGIVASAHGQGSKSGLGASSNQLTNSANARWAYDWGNNGGSSGHNGEYVPMFWNGAGNIEATATRLINEGNSDYVLGFNEPERADQSNLSVATAVDRWRRVTSSFDGTGIKLVGPAVSDNAAGRAWLADFMDIVDSDSTLHVDEVAFHWYGTVNINNPAGGANNFLNSVERYHNDYGRNVWITEFAGLDFGGNFTTQQLNDWNEAFLDIVLPELESRDYVTRYAWWNHNNDSRLVETGIYGRNRPTQVGDAYVGTLSNGDVRDMDGNGLGLDFQYLRGGQLLNNGADRGTAFGRLYALADHDGSEVESDFGGSGDFSLFSWGSVTVEENATLRKIGLNTVTFRNLDLEIDGELALAGGSANEGVLEISGGGTNARGDGVIALRFNGSNLVLGREADTDTLLLPYDFELRQNSTLTVNNSNVELTGDFTVFGQTFFDINQDFEYGGVISSNAAGIVKDGAAAFTLTGDSTYAGFTTIREGSLLVNGTHVGGSDYLVNGGSLGGSGSIDAGVQLNSGSVAPGTGTTSGTRLSIGGDFTQAVGTTVAINTYGDSNDGLDVAGTADLAGNLVLNSIDTSGLQIGQNLNLINAAGGVAGTFASIDGVDIGQVSGLNAGLAVVYEGNDVTARVAILGDADFSNRVDNSDIGTVFANFEAVSDPQWADGNFDGDDAVSNSDIGIVFANFDAEFSGSSSSRTSALLSGSSSADLIYDSRTGQVTLDGSETVGGAITNFVLEGEFLEASVSNPFDSLFFTANAGEISASDGSVVGLTFIDLGTILESDLTLAEVESRFSTSSYVGALGSGQFNFNFIVSVPEPSSTVLIGLALAAMATRRRKS